MFGCFRHLATALLLILLLVPAEGAAQSSLPDLSADTNAASEPVSAEALDDLVRTLEDPAAREKLVGQIKALIDARRQTEQPADEKSTGIASALLANVADQVEAVNRRLTGAVAFVGQLPEAIENFRALLSDPARRGAWSWTLGLVAILLAVSFAAEMLARLPGRRKPGVIQASAANGLLARAFLSVIGFFARLLPVAAFLAALYAGITVLGVGGMAERVAVVLAHGYVALRLAMIVAEALLATGSPALRPLPISDETAQYLLVWTRRIASLVIGGYAVMEAMRVLGLPADARVVLGNVIGLLVAAVLVVIVLQNRRDVSDMMRRLADGEDRSVTIRLLLARFADVWHVLITLYIVAIYMVWALNIEGGFDYVMNATLMSVAVLVAARLIAYGVRRLVAPGFALNEDVKAQFPGLEQRANRYLPVLQAVLQGLIGLVALLALLRAWGVQSFAWLASESAREVVGVVVVIAIVLVIALLVWEGTSAALERYMAQIEAHEGGMRTSRARTLFPMLRKIFLAVLVGLVGLIVLSEIGVDIGPLLAGAGIVGIAIGFGSQKLFQDLITGAFLLVEDTVSVGDVVRAGSEAGVVEQINVRTLVLRDVSGNVHTIPYSTVDRITNLTKTFSRYVFEVGVAYREDLDEVMDVLRDLGAELRKDPEFGPMIRKDLEILGVDQFADSAIIIKARFETEPIKQWKVGREFNRRMKRRFDELDIEIPFPHQTVYFGVDKAGGAPQAPVRLEDARTPEKSAKKPSEKQDKHAGGY
jgi:small-conductance mechanosensitive channel